MYEEILGKLKILCDDDNSQVALKACIEILDRVPEKTSKSSFKWFKDVNDSK